MSKEMAQEIMQMTYRKLITLLIEQMQEEGADEIEVNMDLHPHDLHFKVNLTVQNVTTSAELKGQDNE